MNASQVVVQGTLNPDGTLKLDESPRLPPGPVEVLIRTQPPAGPDGETWWEYLQRERAELLANGHTFRTREEIDNDRARQRSADEARRQTIQDLQTPRE
jgi:hypothetical protein